MCYRGAVVRGHVECPKCGEENPLDRACCAECGEPLVPPAILDLLKKMHPGVPPEDLRIERR